MAKDEGLGRYLVPLFAVGTGILAFYYIVTTFFLGAGNAFMSQFRVMYEEYCKKLKAYAEETGGALTQAQLASKEGEENLMGATLAKAQAAYNDPYAILGQLGALAIGVFGVLAFIIAFPTILQKYRDLIRNNPPQSARGLSSLYECAMVDAFAMNGQSVLATNLLNSLQTYWNSVEVPYMQSAISNWQQQINSGVLTGFQLAYATMMVQSYQLEIASIVPAYFSAVMIPLGTGR